MSKHANLRLTAKLLPIIAPFIAKNDVRYYLNAINVRPHKDGGAVICATNGHVLGAIHDRDAICDHEVILRFDRQMREACAEGVANDRAVVMLGDRLAVVEYGQIEVCIQDGDPEVAAKYPRYESVIPTSSPLQAGLIGTFGAPVLNRFRKAAMAAARAHERNPREHAVLQFFSASATGLDQALVRMVVEPNFVGVIMPMRCDKEIPILPQWALDMQVVAPGPAPAPEES